MEKLVLILADFDYTPSAHNGTHCRYYRIKGYESNTERPEVVEDALQQLRKLGVENVECVVVRTAAAIGAMIVAEVQNLGIPCNDSSGRRWPRIMVVENIHSI